MDRVGEYVFSIMVVVIHIHRYLIKGLVSQTLNIILVEYWRGTRWVRDVVSILCFLTTKIPDEVFKGEFR